MGLQDLDEELRKKVKLEHRKLLRVELPRRGKMGVHTIWSFSGVHFTGMLTVFEEE
jgi:hypothetical protein